MRLVRLVYYSHASREMSLSDLKSILDVARRNNQAQGICGMLSYEQQYFLQALEGERSAVNELYLDIAEDPRHDEITIISYEEIAEPFFKQWKMGYAGGSAEFTKLLQSMGQTEFLPDTMTPQQAFKFLQHLTGNQAEL
ncbi:BLUF domain-containing protein [uncultured Alteromonas sp.]|jgi:hypothetical protein|uniref:BLUF domain-containing protein n=1 Tax=uncultured Alteromonas sp. TaxID=179113 RepID=UPI0025DC7E0B|nr:BLUF domain-containing protein [uncultured Alteromonas sp.]